MQNIHFENVAKKNINKINKQFEKVDDNEKTKTKLQIIPRMNRFIEIMKTVEDKKHGASMPGTASATNTINHGNQNTMRMSMLKDDGMYRDVSGNVAIEISPNHDYLRLIIDCEEGQSVEYYKAK